MRPSAELDQNLSPGVVAEKVFVEQFESDAQHSQEVLDEDDAFLGSATPEVWEYEVLDHRGEEFLQALRGSSLVLEYELIDSTATDADEQSMTVVSESGVYPSDGGNAAVDVTASGSGVRAGDDGPAGMPTGDPSAGGLNPRAASTRINDLRMGDSGGIDELPVTDAGDPRLGLTNTGHRGPDDWAANTGPTRNPEDNLVGVGAQDESSTLSPKRKGVQRKPGKGSQQKADRKSV